MKVKTGIIGASGYTGAELLRLLAGHRAFNLEFATADSQAGQEISVLYPHLALFKGQHFVKFEELGASLKEAELIFCALPHGEAMKILPALENKVVIDLGGDFRLEEAAQYIKWYKHEHTAATSLKNWQYGLTELFREEIKKSNRIANPGCYPTASILPIAPLLKEDLIEGIITINAMSGTSGAGRSPSPGLHASHVIENVRAYKIGEHQHTPEIEMALKNYSGKEALVSFTPHLVPMVRGINSTCTVRVKSGVKLEKLFDCLNEAYRNELFVNVIKNNSGTKEVRGTNRAVISVFLDERISCAVLTCVIDNLVKGAAGQAIQNANLIFNLGENTGLQAEGVYP
jgi:N-acetyl-gamma-glutamyl-phosphate reductase